MPVTLAAARRAASMDEREADTQQVSVARGTFLGVRADVISVISLVVVSIVVARSLGPTGRGVFFLATLVATYAALVGDLGMSSAGIVFSANRRVPAAQLHGLALGFSLVAGLVGAAVLLPLEGFWTGNVLKGLDTIDLALACAGITPQLYGQIMIAVLTGRGEIPVTAAARIAQALALPVIVAPAAIATGEASWAIGGWLAVMVGYALVIAFYTVRRVARPARPEWHNVRRLLSFGVRGYVGTLSYHGFLRLDVFFLSARFGPGLVGLYSLASVVAERVSLIGQAVYSASASRMGSYPREEAAQLAAQVLRMLVLVMVPSAALLAALSWPLFPVAFGSDFADAALPFSLLLPGTVCLTLWYVAGLFIISTLQRPGVTTLIQGAALLLSLPLYYVAVREAEMTGAALVSSGVYASVLVAGLAVLVRNSSVRFRDLVPRRADVSGVTAAIRAALGGARG